MRRRAQRLALRAALAALGTAGFAGCGLSVQAPDLFLLTRSGPGGKLTLLVNDGGTIRCDGGPARHLAGPLLLTARDLTLSLDGDAKRSLRIASSQASVFRYTVRLQDGTISFPDTAGRRRSELARVELFAVQAAQQACRRAG